MKFTDAVYEAADSDDSSTILGDDQHDLELLELKTRSLTRTSLANFLNSPWTFLVHAVIFSLSLTLFITAHLNPPISTQRYLEQYTSWSPARAVVRYEPYTFNSTKGKLSGYMGHGWQVDQKWNRITTDLGDQMISETELEQLGKSNTSTRVMDHATGVEGYRVMLQVFHQLRCLNKLRKAVHWDDYEGDGDLSGDREETRNELDECIELLRMNLMCQSDIGVITFHERPDKSPGEIWPDLTTQHVCRDFDAVRDWAIRHTVVKG